MADKISFWSHPIGKKLSYAIHEQNGGAGIISSNTYLIRKKIENGTLTNEELLKRLESINNALKRQSEGMDYAYKHIKEELGYV